MFRCNSTLVHLDLTMNKLSLIDSQVMNEGLIDNHTLLGLHMIGNEGRVNSLGFIQPLKETDEELDFACR